MFWNIQLVTVVFLFHMLFNIYNKLLIGHIGLHFKDCIKKYYSDAKSFMNISIIFIILNIYYF